MSCLFDVTLMYRNKSFDTNMSVSADSNATRTNLSDIERQERAAQLIDKIRHEQEVLGLTDVEVAARSQLSRMTVQRLKDEDSNPRLDSLIALSAAVGLNVELIKTAQLERYTDERTVIHRGLSRHRLKGNLAESDVKRELAFANAWEAANESRTCLPSLMHSLVPGHTQEQATAAATAVQWLGTSLGFDFLSEMLDSAGYEISEKGASKKKR